MLTSILKMIMEKVIVMILEFLIKCSVRNYNRVEEHSLI